MEDQAIIDLYFIRNEDAILETQNKYGSSLKRIAENIIENGAIAEECENDTYLAAWNSIPPQRPDHLFSYLAKIIRHISLDYCKYKNAQKRKVILVELSKEMEECIPSPSDQPCLLADEELGQIISRFLSTLEQEKKAVFIDRYWYLLSIKTISTKFDMSESKTKSMLFRLRHELKTYLQKGGYFL
jgi:RNA polymerase sigma factor (sigma-70 family)